MIPWSEKLPRSLEGFSREMEGLFERFFGGEGSGMSPAPQPLMNLAETGDAYEVTLDLPGLKPDEVKVEYQSGGLVVSGERKEEEQQEGKTFLRVERRYGVFRRVISLPGAVDEEKIDAEFHDGVLRVTLPKSEHQRGREIHVRGPS
jgi:HSP20 family protein